MAGLLTQVESAVFPREEIRFAVILNGGVSLAVWMGGAVMELDQLTRAGHQPDETGQRTVPPAEVHGAAGVYSALLNLAGSTARADVIAGTSAGGINGAALALSQVNPEAQLSLLRDIWVDQGRLEALMRQPFRGSPSSLLQGDEFFLPQLNNALGILARPGQQWRAPHQAPIDLSITTTVLNGNQRMSVDSLGQQLPQSIHGARFHWRRLPSTRSADDPFAKDAIERTAHRLALAARSTASFPIAFEPSFVPVNSPLHHEPPAGAVLTENQRLRPDMAGVVEDWGDGRHRDRSRFAVDGGLLANTPTRPALEATESMPDSGPVRRVMLLVYPHAEPPGADQPDEQNAPPTVVDTIGGLLGALTAQGSRTFVDEIEEHNKRAAGRRGTRADVLKAVWKSRSDVPAEGGDDPFETLATTLYPHYRQLRRWRAARDVARRAVEPPLDPGRRTARLPEGWNYERVRRAALNAQKMWQCTCNRPSPYYADRAPRLGEAQTGEGWEWGITGALGVAEAAADVIGRLIWITKDADYVRVKEARTAISQEMGRIRDAVQLTDDIWEQPTLAGLQPNESYWAMRLAYYEYRMISPADTGRLREKIEQVAENEAATPAGRRWILTELEHDRTQSPTETTATEQDPKHRLEARLTELLINPADSHAGRRVREAVDNVVKALRPALFVLARLDGQARAGAGRLAADGQEHDERCLRRSGLDANLCLWREALLGELRPLNQVPVRRPLSRTRGRRSLRRARIRRPLSPADLLTRLLQIEIAATTLGDEVSTGATLPVELTQLSAQTPNAFVRYSRTGDDKLGGMSVNRFGGFLKRSWRVNDWTWGRVDAASHLCRVVLQPERIRRTAELSEYLRRSGPATSTDRAQAAEAAEQAAAQTVEEIIARFIPTELRADPWIVQLRDQAVCELIPVLDPATPAQDLSATLPALADLFAWALHLQIVPAELPVLAGAVRADGVEGANARSYGEVFIKEHELLLTRLDSHARGRSPDLAARDRVAALQAFDRAGIGREPLRQEGTSDQMIRTATTAAAVAATVVDSEQSGLVAVKPVTRALRGALLLPFWVVTGLTGKGMLGRSLSLLALAIGAVLLALPLFGALPASLAGPAAALGLSAVIAAFAIGALRSGTMLHGLVLLTPVVPLIVFAVDRAREQAADEAAIWGVSTLLVVLALSAALMVLGSLPATTGSVWSALDRLADRQHIPPWLPLGVRWAAGLVKAVVILGVRIGVGVGVVWLVVWLSHTGWDRAAGFVTGAWPWLVGAAVLAAGIGATAAWVLGLQLQVATLRDSRWTFQKLAHPAGSSAGWAVLYGAGYLVIAAVLGTRAEPVESAWMRSFIATAVVLGVLLILVVPLWLPLAAMRRIADREVQRALSVASLHAGSTFVPQPRPEGDQDVGPDEATARTAAAKQAQQATAEDLAGRGMAYRCFVQVSEDGSLQLRRPLGTSLYWRIEDERARVERGRADLLRRIRTRWS